MALVKADYQHRTDGTELVNHEREVKSHQEICAIVDNYPWAAEIALTEELGEGGGFYFLLGANKAQYASYQLVPIAQDEAMLFIEVVLKPGFLNVLGRKAVSKDFDVISIAEAKMKLKELFDYSIESLYDKYKKR